MQKSVLKVDQSLGGFGQRALKLGLAGLSTVVLLGAAAHHAVAAGSAPRAQAAESFLSTNGSDVQRAGFFADQGLRSFSQGDRVGAAEHWQKALLLYQAGGDRAGTGRMLENLSVIHRFNNEADEAIALSEQAIALYKATGILESQPSAYLNLGSAYRMAARLEEAIASYEDGLEIYQRERDIQGERIMLSLLAQIHKDRLDYPQAIAYQQEALMLSRKIGNVAAEAEALSELGYAYVMNDQPVQAVRVLQSALTIYQQMGDSPEERLRQRTQTVAVLNNLGKAASLAKNYDLALASYREALAIFQALNRVEQEAHVLMNIGQTQIEMGDEAGAISSYRQAISLSETLRQQTDEPMAPRVEAAYRKLAALLQQQNQNLEAQTVLNLL